MSIEVKRTAHERTRIPAAAGRVNNEGEENVTKTKEAKKPAADRRAAFVALMTQELVHVTGGARDTHCDALLCW
jgi:hypothetical protein